MSIPKGRVLFLFAGLLWVMIHVQVCAADGGPVVGRAALVNGAVISIKEFQTELQRLTRMRKGDRDPDQAQLAAIKKQALESLIVRELLCQEAGKRGIRLPEVAVKDQIVEMRRKLGGEAAFTSELAQLGLSEAALAALLERGMIIQKFIDSEFTAKVAVSENEVTYYYEDHPDDFKEPLRLRIGQILIRTEPSWDEEKMNEARARLETVRRRLLAGGDFAQVARESADCPNCKDAGDLGYCKRGDLPKKIWDAVLALRLGELSDIVEDERGFHLLKVTDQKPAAVVPLASVKEKIRQDLVREKQQKKLDLFLKRLRKEAKVEILLNEDEY